MLLNVLINNIDFKSNEGILFDLDYICSQNKDRILEYKISVENNYRHIVSITMDKFSEKNVIELFGILLQFLSFDFLNYYSRTRLKTQVKYTYITAPNETLGYYIDFIFK